MATSPVVGFDPIVATDFRDVLIPNKYPPLADWSEENIVLSPEYSASSTELRLFGWQREIFNAFSDPTVEELVVMSGVQLTKTLLLQCALAYVIAVDPGPILLVEPKEDSANAFSKRRLTPMMRDCPCLQNRLSDSLNRKTNTILSKDFPGGNLLIVSARTPTDLAQHTIRFLICDEPDKYPATVRSGSGEEEGDPMDLAWQRALTFGSRRKRVMVCSPTTAGRSRIGRAYAQSDMRKPYVPCPHCGHKQVLTFDQVKGHDGGSFIPAPHRARYQCKNTSCGKLWTETERWKVVNNPDLVEWRSTSGKPFAGVAGFWINHLYAPPHWKKVGDIAKNFVAVHKDPPRLRAFVNTVLAEEWEDKGDTPDHEKLYARRESYTHTTADTIIPQRALFLTAFTDVQENPPRLECEVYAWGRDRENWSIGYWVIQAFVKDADGNDTSESLPVTNKALWDKLDELVLSRNFRHESGRTLPIFAMGVDTGSRPKPVYAFARRKPQLKYGPAGIELHAIRTVVPTKGNPDPLRIISGISKEDAARKRQGVRIISIGTHCAKQEIYDILQHVVPTPDGTLSGTPTSACYHHPMYEMSYFIGLTSELRIVREDGKVVYEKRPGVERNEPLDLAVGNRAMAAVVGIDRFTEVQWKELEGRVAPVKPTPGSASFDATVAGAMALQKVLTDVAAEPSPSATTKSLVPTAATPATPVTPTSPSIAPPIRRPATRPTRGRFND